MQQSLNRIVKPLLNWFEEHKRALPWRKDREAYHVWISEIMLQQTRIEAVKVYYTRFIEALPDVESLSKVDDDALMKLWEGLGYYSRAKNLKKAARTVMSEYGGIFPRTYKDLLTLSGIGEYTAGAIASICYDERIPAVDGNVLRVITRILGSSENVLLPETKKDITEQLRSIMPKEAGKFNEALMELGETVCLPGGKPCCERCPVHKTCTAFRENLTDQIPVRIKKLKRSRADKSVFLILFDDNKIAIEKRPDKGLLSGTYQLPNIDGFHPQEELKAILSGWGLAPTEINYLKEVKHVFTHIDWYMQGYLVKAKAKSDRFLRVSHEELKDTYPLPVAFRKFL